MCAVWGTSGLHLDALRRLRGPMCGEPCLAHPAEIGAVDVTSHPHPCDHRGRDENDDDTDKQHMVLAVITIGFWRSSHFRTALSVRLCTQRSALES